MTKTRVKHGPLTAMVKLCRESMAMVIGETEVKVNKMASLVADYSDSDEETDFKFTDHQTAGATLFYEADSNDSSDAEDLNSSGKATYTINNADSIDPLTAKECLPHPDFGIGHVAKVAQQDHCRMSSASSSVFTNPFLAEEEAKNLALERHVKMTSNAKSQSPMINGRQVCWNYRKGRCRFGHNCKFAHDSDLSGGGSSSRNFGHVDAVDQRSHVVDGFQDNVNGKDDEEADETMNVRKRKKPGLSNTLLPPKRSMKAYKKQQHQEQPWLKS